MIRCWYLRMPLRRITSYNIIVPRAVVFVLPLGFSLSGLFLPWVALSLRVAFRALKDLEAKYASVASKSVVESVGELQSKQDSAESMVPEPTSQMSDTCL